MIILLDLEPSNSLSLSSWVIIDTAGAAAYENPAVEICLILSPNLNVPEIDPTSNISWYPYWAFNSSTSATPVLNSSSFYSNSLACSLNTGKLLNW